MNKTQFMLVCAALVALNIALGGGLFSQIGEFLEGGRGNALTDSIGCYAASDIWNPVASWNGITYPIPSADDVAASIAILILIRWASKKLNKPFGWKQEAYTLAIIWITLRLTAVIIILAIPGCATYAQHSNELMQPLQVLFILIAPLILIKYVLNRK
jgi:hypothetical protein